MPDSLDSRPAAAKASAAAPALSTAARLVPFAAVHPSPLNPRKHFDPAKIADLAASIAAQGILQNLVLRPHPKKDGEFEIVAGESRWRAVGENVKAKRAGFAPGYELPAVVRAVADAELIELALVENTRRADLTPVEEADAYLALHKAKVTVEQICQRTGFSRRHVQMRMNLRRRLSPKVMKALDAGELSVRQAEMFMFAEPKRQDEVLLDVLSDIGYGKAVTAEDIKESVTRQAVPVARALFPLERYKGEIVEDPDEPQDRYFADLGQFETLQKAAIAERVAEIKATNQGKTVTVLAGDPDRNAAGEAFLPGGWAKCAKTDPKAVVLVVAGRLDLASWPAAKKTVHSGPSMTPDNVARPSRQRDSGSGRPAVPQPEMTNAFLALCRQRKTHALQNALAGDPDWAMRLVLFALTGAGGFYGSVVKFRRENVSPDDQVPNPALIALAEPLRKHFAVPGKKERYRSNHDEGDPRHTSGLADYDDFAVEGADVIRKLAGLSGEPLKKAFAIAVAAYTGSWNDARPSLGDDEEAAALARLLKIDMAKAFRVDAEFLLKCRKPQLHRIILDCKLVQATYPEGGKPIGDMTATELRSKILAHGDRLKGYVPPWMQFGGEDELEALVDAGRKAVKVLAAETVAKLEGAQRRKDKAAAKRSKKGAAKKKAKPAAKAKGKKK